MSGSRKPEGSHKFLGMVVCDRCGHKESWDSGFAAMAAHIREHAEREAARAPQTA